MTKFDITVGSTGKRNKIGTFTVPVAWDALSDEVQIFIIKHGLKQYLADAAAGVTDRSDAEARIKAKLAKLVSGDLSRSRGEGPSRPDTVDSRALKMARDHIRTLLKEANEKADKEAIAEAAKLLVAEEPKWKKEAKAQLDREAQLKAEPTEAASGVIASLLAKAKAAKASAEEEADEADEDEKADD